MSMGNGSDLIINNGDMPLRGGHRFETGEAAYKGE